jgi:hypothetical protein
LGDSLWPQAELNMEMIKNMMSKPLAAAVLLPENFLFSNGLTSCKQILFYSPSKGLNLSALLLVKT